MTLYLCFGCLKCLWDKEMSENKNRKFAVLCDPSDTAYRICTKTFAEDQQLVEFSVFVQMMRNETTNILKTIAGPLYNMTIMYV